MDYFFCRCSFLKLPILAGIFACSSLLNAGDSGGLKKDTPFMLALKGYVQELEGKRIEVSWQLEEKGDVKWRWHLVDHQSFAKTRGSLLLSPSKGYRYRAEAPIGSFDFRLEPTLTSTMLFTPVNVPDDGKKNSESRMALLKT